MGPKKGKDMPDDSWRKTIEAAVLNDFIWSAKVLVIDCAGSDQDRIYLGKFETIAAEERRFVIKNISKTETFFMINQLGGEKKVKDPALRVFEEGQAFLKEKQDVPSELMALTIKHLILKMKDEYLFIQRQKLQVKEGMRRESVTMIDRAEIRGTVSVKPPDSEPVEKPKKGKKGAETPLTSTEPEPGKKYNTQLRVRGEEWRDKVYVDDFPTDGPDIYVAITGFQDPCLPVCLVRVGVPVTAVVQVRIDTTNIRVPSSLSRNTKRGRSQTELLMEKSLNFWKELQELRIHDDTANDLKHSAFVIFTPPYWEDNKLSGDMEKIYDEISFLMYDIQDLSRQHLNYLHHMDIIKIPSEDFDMEFGSAYCLNIGDLPLESVTVYSVLDSILRAICPIDNISVSTISTPIATSTVLKSKKSLMASEKVDKAENLIDDIFNKLIECGEVNRKIYRPTFGDEFENHRDPAVINYGDFSKLPTFHLGNINLDNIVFSMLLGMPVHKLWYNTVKPEKEFEAKINYHINVLLSCFEREGVQTSELIRLLTLLACRKLYNNRSSTKKNHIPETSTAEFKKTYLKRSILAEPLPKDPPLLFSSDTTSPSFPSMTKVEDSNLEFAMSDVEQDRLKFLFDCPDISELVSAAEITSNTPMKHMIEDFEFFEDYSGLCSFQILRDVFNKYNCVDYRYCEVTDSIVLMFFNSHDQEGVAREEWRNHLPTPVCLQDFFDFVLEENYDWIVDQERIYEEKLKFKKQSECKDLIDVLATTSCTDALQHGTDLLVEGSLKHQDLLRALEEEKRANEAMETQKLSSRKSTIMTGSESKKTPPSSTPKSSIWKQSMSRTGASSFVIKDKPFSGYDLGDRRVEILGKDSYFFSKDDTKITTEYFMIIPLNLEYVTLCITPGNGNNVIRIHRAFGDSVKPELLDVSDSFRITCKDDVVINVMKKSYQIPIIPLSLPATENKKSKDLKASTVDNISTTSLPPQFETKFFHGLNITWPNGLIVESVHEEDSSAISHIKQFYLTKFIDLEEDMRCISKVGEVVIFKPDETIEILRPDGTYIIITKCEKRIIIPDIPETSLSSAQSGSDKNKQQKPKGKDKPSRASSKSSKIDNSLKPDDMKPPEYELHIEEYEIIETSGLKQRYSQGIFENIEKLLIRTATEYNLHEIFSRRMDGTNTLLNKDGVHTVSFRDKTRITVSFFIEEDEIFPEWTDEEREYLDIWDRERTEAEVSNKETFSHEISMCSATSTLSENLEEEFSEPIRYEEGYLSVIITYTVEHQNFATVIIEPANGTITVDSPNDTSVSMRDDNFDIKLDDLTRCSFDGNQLHVIYDACQKCNSKTTCDVNIFRENKEEEINDLEECQWWLKMKDSYCKQIVINEEGGLFISDNSDEEHIQPEESHRSTVADDAVMPENTDASFVIHSQCRGDEAYKKLRFFVMRR